MSSTKHLWERRRTHCIGGWMGPRAALGLREKSRHDQDSIHGQCSVVLITEIFISNFEIKDRPKWTTTAYIQQRPNKWF